MASIAQSTNARAARANIPLSALAEITHRCNLHCYYCYNPRARAAHELSVSQWTSVFRQLARAGCLYLTISGGEPFLRKDWAAILSRARDQLFAISIFSNGSLINKEIAGQLSALGVSDVGISLHAATPALHDRLSGYPGSFKKALRSLELLRNQRIKTSLKHTVSTMNFGHFKALKRLAETNGAVFEAEAAVFPHTKGTISPYSLCKRQLREFLLFMDAFPKKPVGTKKGTAGLQCDAGRSVCGISPYGDIFPCIQLPLLFGNIRTARFHTIWKGRAANTFRTAAATICDQCLACNVSNFCGRCPGLSFSENSAWHLPSHSQCLRAKVVAQLAIK